MFVLVGLSGFIQAHAAIGWVEIGANAGRSFPYDYTILMEMFKLN